MGPLSGLHVSQHENSDSSRPFGVLLRHDELIQRQFSIKGRSGNDQGLGSLRDIIGRHLECMNQCLMLHLFIRQDFS